MATIHFQSVFIISDRNSVPLSQELPISLSSQLLITSILRFDYEFACSTYLVQVEWYNACPFRLACVTELVFKVHAYCSMCHYCIPLYGLLIFHYLLYANHVFFSHSFVDGHLCCRHLWLLQITLLWTLVYTYLFASLFSILSVIYLVRDLLDRRVINLLRNHQTIFYSGCPTLRSHEAPIRPLLHQYLLLSGCCLITL